MPFFESGVTPMGTTGDAKRVNRYQPVTRVHVRSVSENVAVTKNC